MIPHSTMEEMAAQRGYAPRTSDRQSVRLLLLYWAIRDTFSLFA